MSDADAYAHDDRSPASMFQGNGHAPLVAGAIVVFAIFGMGGIRRAFRTVLS